MRKKKRKQMISNGEEGPIKECVRSVRFDLENEAESKVQQKLEKTLREECQTGHKVKRFYKSTRCKIHIPKE